jgi:hypothetical protein
MANANSTSIIRNGFEAVTWQDVESIAVIACEQADAMGGTFRAIQRLTVDETIKKLCEHGALQADLQGNDIDCLRERAVKAGVVGDLKDEIAMDGATPPAAGLLDAVDGLDEAAGIARFVQAVTLAPGAGGELHLSAEQLTGLYYVMQTLIDGITSAKVKIDGVRHG